MVKIKQAFRHPEQVLPYLSRKVQSFKIRLVMRYFRFTSDSYTEAYRKLMSYRIQTQDARRAVGSDEHGIGWLQFDFLKEQGLDPDDRLLDLGCGSLRGGEYFINYLNKGKYTGMDISREAIESGKDLVNNQLIDNKQPEFYVNDDLTFSQDIGVHDYVIAQSVFTHIPADDIRECLSNLNRVLAPDGNFYATFFVDKNKSNAKNFTYNQTDIKGFVADLPLSVEFLQEEHYPHPRDQRMVRFTRTDG